VSNGSGTNNPTTSPHGAAQDAGADRGPDFRDPRATDGACSPPNMVCDNACISINNDVDHCGSCTNACQGPGTICVGGACGCGANNEMYCMDGQGTGCRDVKSDVNNCGACGNVCDPNIYDRCENGICLEPE
jgi:hypothetical protein